LAIQEKTDSSITATKFPLSIYYSEPVSIQLFEAGMVRVWVAGKTV